jgi:hypothetical protein
MKLRTVIANLHVHVPFNVPLYLFIGRSGCKCKLEKKMQIQVQLGANSGLVICLICTCNLAVSRAFLLPVRCLLSPVYMCACHCFCFCHCHIATATEPLPPCSFLLLLSLASLSPSSVHVPVLRAPCSFALTIAERRAAYGIWHIAYCILLLRFSLFQIFGIWRAC